MKCTHKVIRGEGSWISPQELLQPTVDITQGTHLH